MIPQIVIEPAKPIKIEPCKGYPVSIELVPKTDIKIEGLPGIPGPYGVGIVDVKALQASDGTVTLYFYLSNGEIKTVQYQGGGEPIPEEKTLEGQADAIATVSATLETFVALSAAANGFANVTALLATGYDFYGAANGNSTFDGRIKADATFNGDAIAKASTAAIIALTLQLASDAVGRTTATGFIQLGNDLALMASATAYGTASGSIVLSVVVNGNVVGLSTASGALLAALDLAGASNGRATAAGALFAALSAMANATGTGTASGVLTAAAIFSGSAMGQGLASGTISAVAAGYDPDAQTAFNAMTVQPNDTRKGQIDTLIKGLKADGIWVKLDWLILLAAHDAQAARLNLRNPAKALAAVNTPSFTVDRGYAGDGLSSHLSFGEAFNPAGAVYALNSAHLGVWCSAQGASPDTRPLIGSSQSTRTYIRPTPTGGAGTAEARMNDSTPFTLGGSETLLGGRILTRTGANARAYYRNGAPNQSDTAASSAIATGPAYLLRNGSTYTDDRLSAATTGSGLTAAEVQALHNRINTFLTSIGAA